MLSILLLAASLSNAEEKAAVMSQLMTVTYICQDAVGLSHYQAARQVALAGLTAYVGRDEAVKLVKDADAKLKREGGKYRSNANPQRCIETINQLYFELK